MHNLTDLESKLLEGLVKKYSSLSSHIPYLKVSERKTTDTGMHVHFIYTNGDTPLQFDEINALFSNEEIIQTKGLKKGLAYVIDVTDGKIEYIEFVTYGEKWNGLFKQYKIVD